MKNKVVVLGASPKEDRYSNMAVNMLHQKGYGVIPVHPLSEQINGIATVKSLDLIKEKIHTLTLYVNGNIVDKMIEEIIALKPARIIFNPGTESDSAELSFNNKGIRTLKACTLVLLTTNQF